MSASAVIASDIRQACRYSSGALPTRWRNRCAKAVRDMPTSPASVLTVQRSPGAACMRDSARPMRASASAPSQPAGASLVAR